VIDEKPGDPWLRSPGISLSSLYALILIFYGIFDLYSVKTMFYYFHTISHQKKKCHGSEK